MNIIQMLYAALFTTLAGMFLGSLYLLYEYVNRFSQKRIDKDGEYVPTKEDLELVNFENGKDNFEIFEKKRAGEIIKFFGLEQWENKDVAFAKIKKFNYFINK